MQQRILYVCAAGFLSLFMAISSALAACEDFIELVAKQLPAGVGDPAVMDGLLKPVIATPQFDEAFNPAQAAELLGDRTVLTQKQCRPNDLKREQCTYQNEGGTALMRLDPLQGKVAYLNRARRFLAGKTADNTMTLDEAHKIARSILIGLSIPRAELDLQHVERRVLMVAGRDPDNKLQPEKHRAEIHLRFPRHVGGTPVFDSDAKLAINPNGHVARLHIQWPNFHLQPGLSARRTIKRETMQNRVVEELSKENQCKTLASVESHIAYVHAKELQLGEVTDEGKTTPIALDGFVPALVVYAVPLEPEENEGQAGQLGMAGQQLVLPLLTGIAGDRQ